MPVQEGNDLGGDAGREADLRPEKVMVLWVHLRSSEENSGLNCSVAHCTHLQISIKKDDSDKGSSFFTVKESHSLG